MKTFIYILLAKVVLGLCLFIAFNDTATYWFLMALPYALALGLAALVVTGYSLCRAAGRPVPTPTRRRYV